MNKTNIITLVVIVVLLCLGAFVTYLFHSIPNDKANSEASQALSTTEVQSFTSLAGEPLDLSSHEGKIRVVNSWASWCPFCVQELRDFETLATEYKDKEVVVIAINRKEPKEQAQAFLNTVGSFENIVFAIDVADSFYAAVEGFAMPETIFYDAEGNVVLHKRGFMSIEEMRSHTETSLNGALDD